MPPKKLSNKKTTAPAPAEEPLKIEAEPASDDDSGDELEFDEDVFDESAYTHLTQKYNLQFMDPSNYENNDIHKQDIVVPKECRMTSEIMSQAEYTRILSERAQQIQNGAMIFIHLAGETTAQEIAISEIRQKKCPMSIVRHITNNKLIKEIWDVNEMIIPFK